MKEGRSWPRSFPVKEGRSRPRSTPEVVPGQGRSRWGKVVPGQGRPRRSFPGKVVPGGGRSFLLKVDPRGRSRPRSSSSRCVPAPESSVPRNCSNPRKLTVYFPFHIFLYSLQHDIWGSIDIQYIHHFVQHKVLV